MKRKCFLTGLDGRIPSTMKFADYQYCFEAAIRVSKIEGSLIWEVTENGMAVVHTVLKSVNGEERCAR